MNSINLIANLVSVRNQDDVSERSNCGVLHHMGHFENLTSWYTEVIYKVGLLGVD